MKPIIFFKSLVQSYTKKDGTFVSDHYDKRSAKKRAASAVARIGGRLLDSVVTGHNSRQNSVSLIGTNITSGAELAGLCQVYRNPQFETFRVFYVKGQRVIGQTGLTSRLPGSTAIPSDFLETVAGQYKRLGADGFWMLHNHPSGDPTPSHADTAFSGFVAQSIPGLLGHVIINSHHYSSWQNGSWNVNSPLNGFADIGGPVIQGLESSPSFTALFPWIGSDSEMAEHAKQAQNKDNAVVVAMSSKGVVRAVAEFHPSSLSDPRLRLRQAMPASRQAAVDSVAVAMRRFAIQSGASQGMVLYCSPQDFERLEWLVHRGLVRDVICDVGGALKSAYRLISDPEHQAAINEQNKALGVLPMPSHRVAEFFA